MPINGFKSGQRVWVEVRVERIHFDFIATILHMTELPSDLYQVNFVGGAVLRFSEQDLKFGRVIAREVPASKQPEAAVENNP